MGKKQPFYEVTNDTITICKSKGKPTDYSSNNWETVCGIINTATVTTLKDTLYYPSLNALADTLILLIICLFVVCLLV